jgi:hypothetical protein
LVIRNYVRARDWAPHPRRSPEGGTLNSAEFAARCVGITVLAYVKAEAVARILDNGANEILTSGAYLDTSPAVVFAPSTGVRFEVDGKPLLVEPEPMLLDHVCITAKGVWRRDGAPGVETTELEEAA